jgi:hypothetical protein
MEQSPSWEADSMLIKKFPTFYRTQRFIAVFTRAHHRFLFWAIRIQSIVPNPVSLRFILILSPNYAQVFWVVSSLQAFQPKFCCWNLSLSHILKLTVTEWYHRPDYMNFQVNWKNNRRINWIKYIYCLSLLMSPSFYHFCVYFFLEHMHTCKNARNT